MNPLFEFSIDLFHQHMQNDSKAREKFGSLKTNCQRVDFAYNYLSPDVPKLADLYLSKRIEKCNNKSLKLREQGNQMFLIKKNLEALLLYTEGIAYAGNDNACLSLAYGNRSAALFEMGYYKECLADINRAFESNYPNNLKAKLLIRQERANDLLTKNPMKSFCYYDPPPDIADKNPHISSAADCVELNRNETFGTHVIATRDITAGEIISVEKPLCCGVANESTYLHCHECSELCYNLIPCPKCATALYCSETCRTTAFTAYHKYECDLGSLLTRKDAVYIKSTLLCIMEYKYSQETCRSNRYKEMRYLETNENVSDNPHLFIGAMLAIVTFHCLKSRTNFLQENDFNEDMVKEILLRNCLIEITNCLSIFKFKFPSEYVLAPSERILVGRAIYAFSSRYSHSCAPNCFSIIHGTRLIMRAFRDINKGEQCTISYGWNYSEHSLTERRTQIKDSYLFTCTCIACKNLWPTYIEDSEEDLLELILNATMRSGHDSSSVKVLTIKLLKMLNDRLEDVTSVDIDEMIACCFNLQGLMVEPCEALVIIKQIIVHLFAFSGNKYMV